MTIERDRRIAIDMVIGAIGVLAALTVAGILYAHFNGGIAVHLGQFDRWPVNAP